MRRPKQKSLADRMLAMLEAAHPAGVPTAHIAQEIYDSSGLESRIKVSRLSRTLRRVGYRVYGVGGMYHLGTEAVLEIAARRYEKMACGFLRGGAEAARGMDDLGAGARGKELRRELKQAVFETLKTV